MSNECPQILEVLEQVVEQNCYSADDIMQTANDIKLCLGKLDSTNKEFSISPEELFGRHCAVLGSTGGGKSWSLARIIEESCKFKCKVILFDASGEFETLDQGVTHLCVGQSQNHKEKSVSVPYYHLRESDLFAIFKPSGPSQGPKFRAAIQSLKLARLSPILSVDGTIIKAHKSKIDFERERSRHGQKLGSPYNEFEIRFLPQQIQNECVEPQRSSTENTTWGGHSNLDLSYCVSLVNRVQDMISSPNLAAIFKPKGLPSLFEEINRFTVDSEARVLRISLKYLPFEYNTREIIGNAIGRYLLEMARRSRFCDNPHIVILDEAHQFLTKTLRDENENFPLDAFGLIAKEGRKYALNIVLSTQRPRDIPEDVLSQVGFFLIHRLTNDHDLKVIERASGTINKESMELVPRLEPGQSVAVGVSIDGAIKIKMHAPVNGPESNGPNYQDYWR